MQSFVLVPLLNFVQWFLMPVLLHRVIASIQWDNICEKALKIATCFINASYLFSLFLDPNWLQVEFLTAEKIFIFLKICFKIEA